MKKAALKNKIRSKSINYRLFVTNIAIVIISLLLLGILSFIANRNVVKDAIIARNLQLASNSAKYINREVSRLKSNLRTLIYFPKAEMCVGERLEIQAEQLLNYRLSYPTTFRAMHLLNNNGEIEVSLEETLEELLISDDVNQQLYSVVEKNELITEAFNQAVREGIYVSPTRIEGIEKIPVITIAISDPESGVVVADIDSRDLWKKLDEIKIEETGRAYIVSQEKTIIANPDRRYIGESAPDKIFPVYEGNEGWAEYSDSLSGHKMIAAFSSIGEQTGWGLVIEQEVEEALTPVNIIAILTGGILIVSLIIGIIFTFIASQGIIQPLQIFTKTIQEITKTGDISQNVTVQTRDEVGALAESFNDLMEKLRTNIKELKILNDSMIGREIRMVELKKELKTAVEKIKRFEGKK